MILLRMRKYQRFSNRGGTPEGRLRDPWATSMEIIIKHFEVATHEKVVLFAQVRGDRETDFKMMVDGGPLSRSFPSLLLLISVS